MNSTEHTTDRPFSKLTHQQMAAILIGSVYEVVDELAHEDDEGLAEVADRLYGIELSYRQEMTERLQVDQPHQFAVTLDHRRATVRHDPDKPLSEIEQLIFADLIYRIGQGTPLIAALPIQYPKASDGTPVYWGVSILIPNVRVRSIDELGEAIRGE